MPTIEFNDGLITSGQLPNGQWTAAWTGPDGKGFGRLADTEEEALGRLHEALGANREEPVSDLVTAALAMDLYAFHYRVRLDPAEARSFARLAPGEGDGTLAVLLEAIDQAIPPMDFGLCGGVPNPNNGLPAHAYDVGNENSRVVYVDWPRTYAPAGFDFAALTDALGRLAQEAGADENGPEDDGPLGFRYRIWWD